MNRQGAKNAKIRKREERKEERARGRLRFGRGLRVSEGKPDRGLSWPIRLFLLLLILFRILSFNLILLLFSLSFLGVLGALAVHFEGAF
jgi:hypothetical protein